MAVRFYLPSSGASQLPALAVASGWNGSVSTFARGPAQRTKTNTALTNRTAAFRSTATRADCWGQWTSEPLTEPFSFTTAHTASLVVRGLEGSSNVDGHLAFALRVVSGDGTVLRGTLATFLTASTEFGTAAATRIHSAVAFGANVAALAGDRLVIEVGGHGVTPNTGNTLTLRFGDPSATADFTLSSGLTTDLVPWLEISATPNFDTVSEAGAASFSLASTGRGLLAAAALGAADLSLAASGAAQAIHAEAGAAAASVTAAGDAHAVLVEAGAAEVTLTAAATTDLNGFVSVQGQARLSLASAGAALLFAVESGAAHVAMLAAGAAQGLIAAAGSASASAACQGAAQLTLRGEGAASASLAASGFAGIERPAVGDIDFALAAGGAWYLTASADGAARFFLTAADSGALGYLGGIPPHLLQTLILAPGVVAHGR